MEDTPFQVARRRRRVDGENNSNHITMRVEPFADSVEKAADDVCLGLHIHLGGSKSVVATMLHGVLCD